MSNIRNGLNAVRCQAVVIWIDWYAYHVARFAGLQNAFGSKGEIVGIELVGGVGVHKGLQFREDLPSDMPIETLLPGASWAKASKIKLSRKLWQFLDAFSPEIVLVPGYYTLPALMAAIWARRNGRISVLMTESTAHDHIRSAWKERIKSWIICSLFDWAVTGGTAHARYLHELNFPPDRIVRFYDVVGNDKLRDAVTSIRSHSTHAAHGLPFHYFLYVGRLAPEKNLFALLRAWIQYRRDGGTRTLVLVGDGPETAALREAASESSFGADVTFAGHKSSRALWPYFAFADCFVLPSTREPWGLVVNEAMAASLPVIVSKACGCAENLVAEGVNGFLFDPESETELLNRLKEFDQLSEGQRCDFGAASAKIIADYSPDSFGKQIARIAPVAAAARVNQRGLAQDAGGRPQVEETRL